ncbi:MAG: polysaccharide deacetylase family protein [Thomasclavelia sp.]|uniref:polysaccharide deacetylase family protein n=1 Tax=Thomasclavelia sp. TaxID=3025757 RepID=UPI0039A08C91
MSKYKLVLILFILIITLIILSIHPTNQIVLYNYHPIIEISNKFDPKSNIQKVIGGSIKDVNVDTSKINFSKPGKYPITYSYNNIKTTITIELKDTIKPDLETQELTIDLGMKVEARDLIKASYDSNRTEVKFKQNYQFNEVGDQNVEIIICRGNNCITKQSVVHILPKDTTPPEIIGIRNLSVLKDSDIDLLSSVSVKDNQDDNPILTIDSSNLDISKVGDYQITYHAKDRSLNTIKETCIVSVVENKTIGSYNQTNEKVVYLTFDDGPSENTQKVLEILDVYDAKATFFVTGTNEEYYYLIKKAHEAGHTIGLHTYVHEYDQIYNSSSSYFSDLKRIEDLVYSQIGSIPKYIRFPGGSSNKVSKKYCHKIMSKLTKEVINRGYQYYDWNEDSEDGSGELSVKQLIKNATASTDNNIILLFHDANGKENSLKALGAVIQYYQKKGYVFKGIDDNSYVVHHSVNN